MIDKKESVFMEAAEIFAHVDHTLLKPCAIWDDVDKLCREAVEYGAASVCIAPSMIADVRRKFPELTICTVIGFPLGYNTTAAKVFEVKDAIAAGADEVDMVINQGWVKEKAFAKVAGEISRLKDAAGEHVLKVIVETCYLNEEEKLAIADIFPATGADYLKTSTGFGSAGAQLADIRLFRAHLPASVKLKAAGGIRSREDMVAFLEAGADRLGCSAGMCLFEK